MQSAPQIGHPIPFFQAKDAHDQLITPDLFLGRPYVIYFYPKNDTPGCTQQACDFRDHEIDFKKCDATIIGISPDVANSHHQFMRKYGLNFILIPDPLHELSSLFGVWEEKKAFGQAKWGMTRTTFVIDAKGMIRWIEKPVQVQDHAERVLKALENLPKASDPL